MKKKLFSHPEAIIASLAIIFLSILVIFYFWVIQTIVLQVQRSLVDAAPHDVTGFDLQAAAKLDLRGLLNQSSSVASTTSTSSISTTTAPAGAASTTTTTTSTGQMPLLKK